MEADDIGRLQFSGVYGRSSCNTKTLSGQLFQKKQHLTDQSGVIHSVYYHALMLWSVFRYFANMGFQDVVAV